MWKGSRLTDQRYARDNRLMTPKSPYRRSRLAPRCRLIASWSWRRFQGFGCSPMKAVRELGLVRWETVRILSFSSAYGFYIQENWENHSFVREDREWWTSSLPVVVPTARTLGRYVQIKEPLKASKAGNCVSKQVSYLVEDHYEIGEVWKNRKIWS